MFNLLISWSRLRSRTTFDCYMEKLKLLISSCRGMIRCAATAVLLTVGMAAAAQTVSISPNTGNVISAASYSGESHLENFGGVWVHNQLPMTLVTSDKSDLMESGMMKEHANNVAVLKGYLVFASGEKIGTLNHMSLSLPKGYRFTSYKIVMDYDEDNSALTSWFKEMDGTFTKSNTEVKVSKGETGIILQRTSLNNTDMGNVLYFQQRHTKGEKDATGMARVKVTSFVVTFECTDKFNESLHTGVTDLANPVSCIALPFQTHRTDLGKIEPSTQGYTSYKYNYQNVKDLSADFLLYDQAGVVGGTAVAGTAGDGAISSVYYNGQLTFVGLKNNTYWLETPTDAITQNGTRTPVGYRIVGARLVYANSAKDVDFKKGDQIYITDGNGRYMDSYLKFTPNKVVWTYDTNGKVYTKRGKYTYYLAHKYTTNNNKGSYYLDVTTFSWNAAKYNTKGLNLFIGSGAETYFVSCNADGEGVYNYTQGMAVVVNPKSVIRKFRFLFVYE